MRDTHWDLLICVIAAVVIPAVLLAITLGF